MHLKSQPRREFMQKRLEEFMKACDLTEDQAVAVLDNVKMVNNFYKSVDADDFIADKINERYDRENNCTRR